MTFACDRGLPGRLNGGTVSQVLITADASLVKVVGSKDPEDKFAVGVK